MSDSDDSVKGCCGCLFFLIIGTLFFRAGSGIIGGFFRIVVRCFEWVVSLFIGSGSRFGFINTLTTVGIAIAAIVGFLMLVGWLGNLKDSNGEDSPKGCCGCLASIVIIGLLIKFGSSLIGIAKDFLFGSSFGGMLFILLASSVLLVPFFLFSRLFLKGASKTSDPQPNTTKVDVSILENYPHFVLMISAAAKLAKADGRICQNEIIEIQNFFDTIGFSTREAKEAQELFREAKSSTRSFSSYIEEFNDMAELELNVNDQQEAKMAMLEFLYLLAESDGGICSRERALLESAESIFGTSYRSYEQDDYTGQTSVEEAYKLFDLKVGATKKEVKSAYRKKCKEFHPDTLASKNLPTEILHLAHEEMIRYTAAYERILRE